MIKHFCDICEKSLSVQNTALSNASLIQRDFDGVGNLIYFTEKGIEICDECACVICDVMDALKKGKGVKYK